MKKLSVILPIYNVKEYIDEAIKSLINQTIGFDNLEVILVNDGSNDGTEELIDSYAKEYDNIKVIHLEEASGAAGRPRNIGFENATSEYVMFLDPDDVYSIDACEKLYKAIIENNSDIAVGKSQRLSSKGIEEIPLADTRLQNRWDNVKIEQLPSLLQEFIHLNSMLYKREFIINNSLKFEEGRAAQDALFLETAFLLAETITYMPEVVYSYRMRENKDNMSVTQGKKVKYFKDFIYISKKSRKLYENHIVDYFTVRYPGYLGWALLQIEGLGELSDDEKTKILDISKPIIELSKCTDISYLTSEKQKLVQHIIDGDYTDAFKMMKSPDSAINLR